MAYNVVSLILDLYDGSPALISQGSVKLAPSAQVTDATDNLLVIEAPVWASLSSVTAPKLSLLATDNANLLPSGWAWTLSFPGVPGNPGNFNVFLPAAPQTFTATNASPCVFTGSGAGYLNSTGVQLSGGSLPAGFTAATTYYVVNASGSAFQLAATANGSPLASTSAGSGSVIAVSSYLSSLSPVSPVTTMAAYMPLPSGTPAAGDVPAARDSTGRTAWSTVVGKVFSILDYGADPTGVSDSTAAITAAKTAAGAGSRSIILIPPGTYLTNPFSFDGFHWLGYGPQASFLKANASSSSFATNNQAATNERETIVEGLSFDGSALTGTAAVVLLGNSFFGANAPTFIMRDCWVYGGPAIGMDVSLLRGGLADSFFEKVMVHDNAGYGKAVGSDQRHVGGVAENNGKAGYYISGNSSFSLIGEKAYSNGAAYPGGGAAFGYGFLFTGQGTGAVIAGCLAQDNFNSGVAFAGAQGYDVTGIACDSNSARSPGTYPAVTFASSSSGNRVSFVAVDRDYNGGLGGNCQLNALSIDSGSIGNIIDCAGFYKTAGPSALAFFAPGSGGGAGNSMRIPSQDGTPAGVQSMLGGAGFAVRQVSGNYTATATDFLIEVDASGGYTIVTLPTSLAAPAAPGVSNSGTGGTVAAGTYQVKVTYVNDYGESVASTSTSTVTSGSASTITITSPAASGNATGWYAYVTQAGGSTYTRQQAAGSPAAIGTNLTITAPPSSTGAAPPAAGTTGPATGQVYVVQKTDGTSQDCDVIPATGTVNGRSAVQLPVQYDYTMVQWDGSTWIVIGGYFYSSGLATTHNTLDDGFGDASFAGTVSIVNAGVGFKVKEGSNAKQGTAVLSAGSVVVANTSVTANSRIFLTSNADGGTPGWLRVSARTAGTSFTITSSSGTDASTVAYEIFEPA